MDCHIRFFSVLVAITLPLGTSAQAQTCGCNPLPSEGAYSGPAPLFLSYEDGDADNPPTQIRLKASRPNAPDMDVVVQCDGASGKWQGTEYSPFGGPFIYELSAVPKPPSMAGGGHTPQLAQAMRMTEEISLTIILPPKLAVMGKAVRTATFTTTGGQAAENICQTVKDELAFVQEVIAAYNAPDLISYAQANNLNGNSNKENFWMDKNRQLHPTGPQQKLTYEDIVKGRINGTVSVGSAGVSVSKETTSQNAEVAGNIDSDSLQPGAYAQTNPISCKITMMPPDQVARRCEPAIVLEAAYVHENRHAALCNSLNETPVYQTPSGERINWKTDLDVFGIYNLRSYPKSGYTAWLQNPINQSSDEAAASSAEAKVLSQWLAAKCQ